MIVLYLLHLDPVMASRVLISCGISSVMLFYVRNHKLLPYLFQIYVASIGVKWAPVASSVTAAVFWFLLYDCIHKSQSFSYRNSTEHWLPAPVLKEVLLWDWGVPCKGARGMLGWEHRVKLLGFISAWKMRVALAFDENNDYYGKWSTLKLLL